MNMTVPHHFISLSYLVIAWQCSPQMAMSLVTIYARKLSHSSVGYISLQHK